MRIQLRPQVVQLCLNHRSLILQGFAVLLEIMIGKIKYRPKEKYYCIKRCPQKDLLGVKGYGSFKKTQGQAERQAKEIDNSTHNSDTHQNPRYHHRHCHKEPLSPVQKDAKSMRNN